MDSDELLVDLRTLVLFEWGSAALPATLWESEREDREPLLGVPSLEEMNAVLTSLSCLTLEWVTEKAKNFLDETAAFWERRTGALMSGEQAREAAANVVGFIKTLARWEKAERSSQ